MTPTPDMEAFAREIATKHFGTSGNGLMIRIMSVAIMEASEKAAALSERSGYIGGAGFVAPAIRNGEHLR